MKKKNSVTVFDVARYAGVSKSTVSLVLTQSDKVSEKSREKVIKAIKETGYVYNRDAASLRSRRSNLVAIVINDLTNPYSAQLCVALEQEIQKIGMFAILVNSSESVEKQTKLIEKLEEYNVAAYVICPAPNTQANSLNDLVDKGRKIISIMREVEGANVTNILPDNITGAFLSSQHLIEKGYQKIAFIGGNKSISDYHQRRTGFLNACENNKITINQNSQIVQSETNRHGGREAMRKLQHAYPEVEAIVCFNDVVAYGAIEYMKENNIKPGKDIAIVGFDDLNDSQLMSPSLTTIHIDADKIAQAVCAVLEQKDVNEVNKTLVSVELLARDSA